MRRRRAVQQLQLEGVIASAAHCDVTSKHEVEQLVSFAVQQVTRKKANNCDVLPAQGRA